jgi:hypothetical protein
MGKTKVRAYKGKAAFLKKGIGAKCCYCKRIMIRPQCDEAFDNPGLVVSVEHKEFPKSKGGTNDPHNLDLACKRCNSLRGNSAIQLFEPFSRVIIQRYPNAPLPILREAWKDYVYHLAELSISNSRGIKAATLATLIDIDKQIEKREIDAK